MTQITPNKTFPKWLDEQPSSAVWESKSPYACPVCCYLRDTVGGWCAVYESSIEAGGNVMLLSPNHRIRRLVVRLDRTPGTRIGKQQIAEYVQDIWFLNTIDEEARIEQKRADDLKQRFVDWGW